MTKQLKTQSTMQTINEFKILRSILREEDESVHQDIQQSLGIRIKDFKGRSRRFLIKAHIQRILLSKPNLVLNQ